MSYLLTFREEIRPCAILTHVKVLPKLVARLKTEHGMVIEAIISKQHHPTWFQNLLDKSKQKRVKTAVHAPQGSVNISSLYILYTSDIYCTIASDLP